MGTEDQIVEYTENKNMPHSLKEPPVRSLLHVIWPVLLPCIAAFAFIVVFFIYRNAETLGAGIAELPGKAAGMAAGSYRGFTEGIALGQEAGKEAGLKADDTEVKIEDEIYNIGNLEVLVAGVKIGNFHEYAGQYSALYIYKADAVFSIDLSKAEISYGSDNSSIFIHLPEPKVNLYINENAEKLAEWQKGLYTGDAKDGYIAYLNSMKNLEKISPKAITGYEALMEQAKEAAIRQVSILAKAVCREGVAVRVVCEDREE